MILGLMTIKIHYLKIKSQSDNNKRDHHDVYTEEVNKIEISSNDNKRIQTFDGVTTYPYHTKTFTVCELELLIKIKDQPIAMYY